MSKYYFVLGKEGDSKRYKETFNDAKKDLGINALERLTTDSRSEISILIDILGGYQTIRDHFKKQWIRRMKSNPTGKRRSWFISSSSVSFYFQRLDSLRELVDEGTLTFDKGWYRLTKKERIKCL